MQGLKIVLKKPERADLPAIAALWGDAATMKEVGGPLSWPEEKFAKWFEKVSASRSDCYFLVLDQAGGCVGEASFHDYKAAEGTARLNLKIAAAHRGRGYGREAALLLLHHFFHDLDGQAMTDDIAPGNSGAQKLFLSLGFERLPEHKDVFFVRLTKDRFYRLNMAYFQQTMRRNKETFGV
ncbi:MAG: GNAT family N-acetyltransferase [Elusimicrobiales bacterium]|nr:GNAT family N-acetyltransferase [Elusimicrobiales bacterium]